MGIVSVIGDAITILKSNVFYYYADGTRAHDIMDRIPGKILFIINFNDHMSNFSKYIDSLIAGKPVNVDGQFGAQCVDFARAVSLHLGFPITSYGNAWDIYKKGSEGYHVENVGSYKPLAGDLLFMGPAKANGKAGHIAVADEGCSVAVYKVVHQNYGVQGTSGSGVGDRHAKRQTIPAQQWGGILARNTPFQIK